MAEMSLDESNATCHYNYSFDKQKGLMGLNPGLALHTVSKSYSYRHI